MTDVEVLEAEYEAAKVAAMEAQKAHRLAEEKVTRLHYAIERAKRQETANAVLATLDPELVDVLRYANSRIEAVKALRENDRISHSRFYIRVVLTDGGLPKDRPALQLASAAHKVLCADQAYKSSAMRDKAWELRERYMRELRQADDDRGVNWTRSAEGTR